MMNLTGMVQLSRVKLFIWEVQELKPFRRMRHRSQPTSLYLLPARGLCPIFSLVHVTRLLQKLEITSHGSPISPFSPEVVSTLYGVIRACRCCVRLGRCHRREEVRSVGKVPFPSLQMGSLTMRGCLSLRSGVPDSLGPQGTRGALRVLWTPREGEGSPGDRCGSSDLSIPSDICDPAGTSCRHSNLSLPPWRMPGALLGEGDNHGHPRGTSTHTVGAEKFRAR